MHCECVYIPYTLTFFFSLQLDVYVEIASILTFDMTTGKVVCPGYMQLFWIDEELVWNTTEFSDISHLSLPSGDIWTPQFIQWGAGLEISSFPALVLSNGTVFWMIGSVFEGTCKLDMRKYPIDSHSCVFYLQPETTMPSDIKLTISNSRSNAEIYEEHCEWEITKTATTLESFLEPSSGIRYFALSKTIQLSRRYLFKVIHTCIPVILLSALDVMIFLIPLKSGERITFAVTVLLTFVVFTSNSADDLPNTSLTISYYSISMAILNCTTTLAVITSVTLCRMAHETIRPVPEMLLPPARKFISIKKNTCKRKNVQETTIRPFSPDENRNEGDIPKVPLEFVRDVIDADENDITWEVVANMFDTILFYLNFLLVLITGITIGALFAT